MAILPERYSPVIGSLNEELLAYATAKGIAVPDPSEVMRIVDADGERMKKAVVNSSPVNEVVQFKNPELKKEKTPQIQYGFCRKCGTRLVTDSGFCHKCGTQIVKQ